MVKHMKYRAIKCLFIIQAYILIKNIAIGLQFLI